jgi:mannose-1-phosphate guanylyltransferase
MASAFACVLAGGSGERFWPMSRGRTPKHLLKLLSARTMIEETVERLAAVVPRERILILTAEAQVEGIRAALPTLARDQVVAEPARRDTAPAAALATALARARDPEAVVALFPADACIHDQSTFARQLSAALDFAADAAGDMLLTFGIKPDHPGTGFGYLEIGEELARRGSVVVRRVVRFVEKPDEATARRYLAEGRHAWNAGMFLWRANAFLAEADRQAPELAAFIREFPQADWAAYIRKRFPGLPRVSVDYAIMEKARSVGTILADYDWDDVGTWTALPRHLPVDASGNCVRGPVAAVDSSNNIVVSNGRMVALCGVHDLVVVETPDAVLVCHRDAAQNLKRLHPLLPKDVL